MYIMFTLVILLYYIFNVTQFIYFIPQMFRCEKVTRKEFTSLSGIVSNYCQKGKCGTDVEDLKRLGPRKLYDNTRDLLSAHLKALTEVRHMYNCFNRLKLI